MKKNIWKFPKISKNEYLGDIIDCIPSNIILFKILTGIGATTLEIEYLLRNSIIIEPNLPVIKGKCKKYNKSGRKKVILGVYEGITVDHIIDYLQSDVKATKILTTPESFFKVQQAFDDLGLDMYTHSFLLFDECERVTQDVGYRSKITLPIDYFFKFKDKAFISATPVIPTEPRFEIQNFKHVYIKPDFDIKESIRIVHTNNILYSFAKFIEENARDQYFIFFNSTDSIASIIKSLNLNDESAVFCAKESKGKLKVNGFKHLSTDIGPFQKYNFFTSRFFSAVDIDDILNPTIIIISDLVIAPHSKVDPKSEVIQIAGRFRKVEGQISAKEIIHITNTDPNVTSKTEIECAEDRQQDKAIYTVFKNLYDASTSVYAREVLKEAMTTLEFAKYLNFDGTENFFMHDNTVYEESIKYHYQTLDNLKKAYAESKRFKIKVTSETYDFSDWDRARTNKYARLKTIFEVIMPVIKDLYERKDQSSFAWKFQIETLKEEFPSVFDAFEKIGLDKAKELEFGHVKIRKAIKENELLGQKSHFGFIRYIQQTFIEGQPYSSASITNKLKQGLSENGLKLLTPGVKLLRQYCELSERLTIGRNESGNEVKGYRVIKINHKHRNV